MPNTLRYALSYPAAVGVAPDVPYWLQRLAEELEFTMGTLVKPLDSDPTFPKAATAATGEVVLDRYTLDVTGYDYRLMCAAHVYFTSAQAGQDLDLIWYLDNFPVGYARENFATVGEPQTLAVVADPSVSGTSPHVLELRAKRFTGTGTYSTSISQSLTEASVLRVRL